MLSIPNINPVVYQRGANGVPSTTPIPFALGGRIERYQHAINATFGFESMSCSFTATQDEALAWFDRLMCSAVVFGPDSETIWEGYLTRVEATFGQERRSISIDDMANRVRCRYTTVLGTPGTTSTVSDSASISLYGTKDFVLSIGEITATAASNFAAKELARRKNPKPQPITTVSTGDTEDIQVTLTFAGWYETLDWVVTSLSTTSSAVTTTHVGTLLTTLSGTNNFISTNTSFITASGISDTQYISPDTTYRQKIEALLEQGNSSNQRLCWGVYEDRLFYVEPWAGANPDTIHYYRFLGNPIVYTSGLGIVEPWNVRPNKMYTVVELLDVNILNTPTDTMSKFPVERVNFAVDANGYDLQLEPEATDSFDALLARLK